MRLRLALIALAVWLFTRQQPAYAQSQNSEENSQRSTPCLNTRLHDEPPSGPEISISDVTFSGNIQIPISDQDRIAARVKLESHGYPVDTVVEDALERLKAGWQDGGYFKVEVSGEARTATKTESNPQIALFVHVDENAQYRLGGITFKNNRAIYSARLRDLFRIRNGDIFSREKIANGLENLRKAYGEFGYLNYTGVPSTTFDDEKKLAYLEVDVDEGKEFIVSDVKVEGLDGTARQHLLKELALKPGGVYNSRLWELSLSRISSLFPGCDCNPFGPLHLDERTGTVEITLDLRPCSAR
jgi:outer membrane protein insertion porin family